MSETDVGVCDAAITAAFSILGKRWNGMILSVLGGGALSFVEVRRAVTGISDTVLSDRLSELVDAGVVGREVDAGPPVAVRYELTEAGHDLVPSIRQLGVWASRHLPAPEGIAH